MNKSEEADFRRPIERVLPWLLSAFALLAALGAVGRVFWIVDPKEKLDSTTLLYLGVAGALLMLREVKALSFGDYKVEFDRLAKEVKAAQVTADDAQANALGSGGKRPDRETELVSPMGSRELHLDRVTKLVSPVGSRELHLDRFDVVAPNDDPQKGRFGGFPERNNRRLSAGVSSLPGSPRLFEIRLKLLSTNPLDPVRGSVEFFLHPTFSNDHPIVTAGPDGTAELTLRAWGAFTVGVICDKGATKLELDLAELKDAPREFRDR